MLEHQAVLCDEVVQGLNIETAGNYIDGTFGRGGHSLAILKRLGSHGHLLAFDKDFEAIAVAKQKSFAEDPRFRIVHGSFTRMEHAVRERGWWGKVNGILLDLGVSSPQLDDPSRGFSFMEEGPLDMRMDPSQKMTAAKWVNQAKESDIRDVLRTFGEERFAKRIAHAIVNARQQSSIETTTELAAIVAKSNPSHERKKHPATRSFQAIRIYINSELTELRECLSQCLGVLAKGGRLCVISFHSLEDRIVKQFIQKHAKGDDYPPDLPILESKLRRELRSIGRLIRPNDAEVTKNPRSRSARLRIAEKII